MAPTQLPGRQRPEPSATTFLGAGFEFAAVVAVLTGAGWWLDQHWATEPWLRIVGVGVGVVGETYKLYRLGKRFFR